MEESETEQDSPMMALLMNVSAKMDSMDSKMGGMDRRLRKVEERGTATQGGDDTENGEDEAAGDRSEGREMSPSALRDDARAMRRAAERIAQFHIDDDDEDNPLAHATSKKAGKKSGSTMLAADVVKKAIDWPHLYVTRLAGESRDPVPYSDLRTDEFVYGYLMMLKNEACKWDKDRMLEILEMLMQDSMDYAWGNARTFYQQLGLDVEKGVRQWSDREGVRDLRFLHSRTGNPTKKEPPRDAKKPNNAKAASNNTKCCALYQLKTCEHNRDHAPFAHACAYCSRVTGVHYKHPEADCFRKSLNEAKNGPKRE